MKWIVCLLAVVLLSGCGAFILGAEEPEDPGKVPDVITEDVVKTKTFEREYGAGKFYAVNFKSRQLLGELGTAYYADIFAPFDLNLAGKDFECNTKLVAMYQEGDIFGGGCVSVKGITFFEKDIKNITLKGGADPTLLVNGSELWRNLFQNKEFNFNDTFKLGGLLYAGVTFHFD